MSVVIIGGHDRMIRKYKEICSDFKCRHKIFTHMSGGLTDKIGNPDLIVVFTSTMSHKMLRSASEAASRNNVKIVHSKTSSSSALVSILQQYCA